MIGSASVIVINFGSPQLIRNLLASLSDHPDRELVGEVVIVDNGYPETGDSRQTLSPSDYPFAVKFVQNTARGYASGINRGAEQCRGKTIIVSNNDVEWVAGSGIKPLLQLLESDRQIGVAGPQLIFPDGSWQRSYGRFPSLRQGIQALCLSELAHNALLARRFNAGSGRHRSKHVDYVDGAFMTIRRECFDAVGGFDQEYGFYGEDLDFCQRARQAGWTSVYVPTAHIMHVRGASSTVQAPEQFSAKALSARCTFVDRQSGPAHAKWYAQLQRMRALELSWLYKLIFMIRRTPAWRRRTALAAASARAASAFCWSPKRDTDSTPST